MLEMTVLIQNITNLSDARYFAAQGVDYISFNNKPDSEFHMEEEKIKEIKEWVTGPKILLESNSIEYADIFDGQILDLAYASLPINKISFFRTSLQTIIDEQREGKFIVGYVDNIANRFEELPQNCEVFVDATSLPFEKIQELSTYGLVLQGGDEEKVGFKDFDELDQIFEWISN